MPDWPWVSRRRYDLALWAQSRALEQLADAEQERDRLRYRMDLARLGPLDATVPLPVVDADTVVLARVVDEAGAADGDMVTPWRGAAW